MTGLSVAIFGAGRSGRGAAEAVLARGGRPAVYEEAPAEKLTEAGAALAEIGVELVAGWTGEFAETGCEVVVTSPGVDRRHPKLQAAVAAGIEVISEIELACRISRAPIVAITGTNGKSTTTVMTWLCLRAAGVDAVLCGNIYGSGYEEAPLTEAAAQSKAGQILVAEVSSFQLEWISRFHAVSAGITNVSPDHLNRYAGFEEYAATKRRVFANQGTGDTAVVRLGDLEAWVPSRRGAGEAEGSEPSERVGAHTGGEAEGSGRPQVKTFGWEWEGFASASAGEDRLIVDGATIDLNVGERPIRFLAEHDKLNACMALLLAQGALRATGAHPTGDLTDGLREFRGLSHRMELLGGRDGVTVVNNSMCTNPKAVESSSRSLKGRQHLLIGGVNKELGFDRLGEYLRSTEHRVYVFGRDATPIAAELNCGATTYDTMGEAFSAAAREAAPGETIMLSPGCASFDQFADFRQRGEVFRELVERWRG